jgi:hypothetical protein
MSKKRDNRLASAPMARLLWTSEVEGGDGHVIGCADAAHATKVPIRTKKRILLFIRDPPDDLCSRV